MEGTKFSDSDLSVQPFCFNQISFPRKFEASINLLANIAERFTCRHPKSVKQILKESFERVPTLMWRLISYFEKSRTKPVELYRFDARRRDNISGRSQPASP
ncbi:hypothetical protein PHISP_08589 [Aspergillus sp. HF37]|nr:hypothetical protein PHISP_08589 [Aspergillus sp. HF37]